MEPGLSLFHANEPSFAGLQHTRMREWQITPFKRFTVQPDAFLVDQALGLALAGDKPGGE
jgi:hypothetical protein